MNRRTIHERIETGQFDRDLSSGGARYLPRTRAPHKLDPYTGIIDARLEEFTAAFVRRRGAVAVGSMRCSMKPLGVGLNY